MLNTLRREWLMFTIVLILSTSRSFGQVSVLQAHNDSQRSGANVHETLLTPSSVGSGNFEKLFTLYLPTQASSITAQPLIVPSLQIGGSLHNVLFIANTRDEVYAFDADNGTQLWFVTLLDAAHGAGPDAPNNLSNIPCAANTTTIRYGVYGTPVIDPTTGTIYLVSRSWESGVTVQRIHALDITTGNEKFGGPIAIQATVSGSGWESDGAGHLSFDPLSSFQRAGMLLLNGVIYVGFGSFCEPYASGWHGWLMGYNAANLQQTSAWVTTPDATESGIWMGGAGLAADVPDPVNHPFGRMFVATGNGTFNAMAPYLTYRNFGDDIIRLDLTGGVITPQDSFTVSNQSTLNSEDGDLGSGGVLVLPDSVGSAQHPHLLVQSGKPGAIYLVDRDNMGGYNSTDNIVQELPGALGPMYSTPAYWNGSIYFWGYGDSLKAYSIANGVMSATPTSMSSVVSDYPGTSPSISSNGNMNGIVWGLASTGIEGSLQAYDATNVSKQLYDSDNNLSRDDPGARAKFSVATVANGKVYVGSTYVYVYGSMFTVSASSSTVQATAGSNGTLALQAASPFGSTFTGAVSLNSPDLPAGVSPVFSNAAVTLGPSPASGSSTLTLNVSSSVAAGSYLFHVTGSNGSLLSSAALTLTVIAAQPVSTPSITPGTAYYTTPQTVTITDATQGATIYFTTDASTPNTSSRVYAGPFIVLNQTKVEAIAVATGLLPSSVASASLMMPPPAPTPTFNPPAGTYSLPQNITVSDSVAGSTIYYTTNGKTPTISSTVYTGPIPLVVGGTIKAIAVAGTGYSQSVVGSAAYVASNPVATPSITPATGNYTTPQLVTITDATPGTTIYYTLNASVPTTASTLYKAPFTVYNQTKIEAIAVASVSSQSLVGSASLAMPPAAPTPSFTPAAGTYSSPQTITISDSVSGCTIYYTTNGGYPSTSSPVYKGPIAINASQTVRAIAIAPSGYTQSLAGGSSYIINTGH